jgi:AraC-binding-like domain
MRLGWQAAVAIDPGELSDYCLLCMPTRGHLEYRQGPGLYLAMPGQMVIVGGSQRSKAWAARSTWQGP